MKFGVLLRLERVASGHAVDLAEDSERVGGLELLGQDGVGEVLEANGLGEAKDGSGSDRCVLRV